MSGEKAKQICLGVLEDAAEHQEFRIKDKEQQKKLEWEVLHSKRQTKNKYNPTC